MITCQVTYQIDPAKITDFETYAKAWIPFVERFGGVHHRYFFPHEGPNDLALLHFHSRLWQITRSIVRTALPIQTALRHMILP